MPKRLANSIAATTAPRTIVGLGMLADLIGFHLRLAQEASFNAFARRVRATDLGPGRFAMLVLIAENPGLSQSALGRASRRDKSSLTPALEDLERRALVQRRRSPTDRRSKALSLTPEGDKLLRKLIRHARAHDRALDAIVGLADKPAVLAALQRIALSLG